MSREKDKHSWMRSQKGWEKFAKVRKMSYRFISAPAKGQVRGETSWENCKWKKSLALHSRRVKSARENSAVGTRFPRDFRHCTEKPLSRFSDMVAETLVGENKRKGVAKLYLVYLLHLFTLSFSRSVPTSIRQIELLNSSGLVASSFYLRVLGTPCRRPATGRMLQTTVAQYIRNSTPG